VLDDGVDSVLRDERGIAEGVAQRNLFRDFVSFVVQEFDVVTVANVEIFMATLNIGCQAIPTANISITGDWVTYSSNKEYRTTSFTTIFAELVFFATRQATSPETETRCSGLKYRMSLGTFGRSVHKLRRVL
jgi:hypothetical protein